MSTAVASNTTKSPLAERLDIIVTPIFAGLLAIVGIAVWLYSDIDPTTAAILAPEKLQRQLLFLL